MNWRTLFQRRPDGRCEPVTPADLAAFDAILEARLTVAKAHREAKSERSRKGHSTSLRKRREQAETMLGRFA